MTRWLGIVFGTLRSCLRTHRELALENLALRQQLAVWKAREPRPRLTEMDRLFWVFLSRVWTNWRHSLHVVRPQTVVRWHRQGFRRLSLLKSCPTPLICILRTDSLFGRTWSDGSRSCRHTSPTTDRTQTHLSLSRRTQASESACAEPGHGSGGAARRWTASPIPAPGG